MEFTFNEIANTPAAPGQMYSFDLSEPFWNVTISKFLLHPSTRFPYKELEYSTVFGTYQNVSKLKLSATFCDLL